LRECIARQLARGSFFKLRVAQELTGVGHDVPLRRKTGAMASNTSSRKMK
jgi:hypothetical protein